MDMRRLKRKYVGDVLMVTLALMALCATSGVAVAALSGGEAEAKAGLVAAPGKGAAPAGPSTVRWDLSIAIAVAIGLPCVAAGYAVGRIGAAALGAASEKPELLMRSLLFVALAEGIAIYGLLVSVMLWLKM